MSEEIYCKNCNSEIWINIHNNLCGDCYYEENKEKFTIFATWCTHCKRLHHKREVCPKLIRDGV